MSLWKALAVRAAQGKQTIADVRGARPAGHRGLPVLDAARCPDGCRACQDACPTAAIDATAPTRLALDLGRCVFCTACVDACPADALAFTPDPRIGAGSRAALVVTPATRELRVPADGAIARAFKRSLRLRQVSAGGCNACELELNATANVNFDVQRFGVEWVASPRHADALVLTGPITRTMADAVRLAWDAMPEPRFVIAVGACAISGGLFAGATGITRAFLDDTIPALYVPGCPPHPLAFVNAVLDLIGR